MEHCNIISMGSNFDGCSYNELTECIKSRVRFLREYKKIINKDILSEFPVTKAKIRLSAVVSRVEIRYLLEARRKLKKSGRKNWNSELFK